MNDHHSVEEREPQEECKDTEESQLEESKVCRQNESTTEEKFPTGIYYILFIIFCERFAFVGTLGILVIFFTEEMGYDDDHASVMYHFIKMIAFFSPPLGAVVADSWVGAFWTISSFSVFNIVGYALVVSGSVYKYSEAAKIILTTGLTIAGCCSGGTKPCLAAFGGNQFGPKQISSRATFFSLLYFVSHVGVICATILMPILRSNVDCFDSPHCYPLAFFIPAVLMVIGTIIFFSGKHKYKLEKPASNIILQLFGCISYAIIQKIKSREKNKGHWLDYAQDKYDAKFVDDLKYVIHVWFLLLPISVFWALFNQQGSSWILQAKKLSGNAYFFTVLPDQMKVFNTVLILIFIPLFDFLIYPAFEKCHLLKTPLQRIGTGGILAAVAFFFAGFLELAIERDLSAKLSSENYMEMYSVKNSICLQTTTQFKSDFADSFKNQTLNELLLEKVKLKEYVPINCSEYNSYDETYVSGGIKYFLFYYFDSDNYSEIKTLKKAHQTNFPSVRNVSAQDNIFLKTLKNKARTTTPKLFQERKINDSVNIKFRRKYKRSDFKYEQPVIKHYMDNNGINESYPNEPPIETSISIFYQVPQYIFMTMGEVMLVIEGIRFCYTQAPISMKAVLQGSWIITAAFGNLLLLVIIHVSDVERQSVMFFTFSSIMILDMVLFAILAHFYKYVEIEETAQERFEHITPHIT